MCAIVVYVRIRARISSDTDSGVGLSSAGSFLFTIFLLMVHNSVILIPGYFSAHPHNLVIIFAHHSIRNLLAPARLPLNRDKRITGRAPYPALGTMWPCAQTHNSVFRWRMAPASRPWRLAFCSKCCRDTSPFRPRMPLASGNERVPALPIDSSADRDGARATEVV